MIFVDSNLFIYAVGRPHPLRQEAQDFFLDSSRKGKRLVISAEIIQELLHVYLPVGRMSTLDAALKLATQSVDQIFSITGEAVKHARNLADKHTGLTARDLLHLSVCQLNKVSEIKTFDRNLLSAFSTFPIFPQDR